MRMIISGERGRECKNLEKFWVLTKEKLERSDHDFELAFNRFYFIARSKVGLLSADVIDNVLFYLSVMYKSCYHSLCVLQAYEAFLRKVIQENVETLSEACISQRYYQSFQEGHINKRVSEELLARFLEMLVAQPEKAKLLEAFFNENNIVLLKLIAYFSHFSIGYQTGNETKRRAYLFAKLLSLIREALHQQLARDHAKLTHLDPVNIDSITPNLRLKIDLFDFGICFNSGKVITQEFASSTAGDQQVMYKGTRLKATSTIPKTLRVLSSRTEIMCSDRLLFDNGIVYLPSDNSELAIDLGSQVYLASSGGSMMWRLAKKLLKKCVGYSL